MPCPVAHLRVGHIREYSLGVDVSDDEAADSPIPDRSQGKVTKKKKKSAYSTKSSEI